MSPILQLWDSDMANGQPNLEADFFMLLTVIIIVSAACVPDATWLLESYGIP
jgi:hypothetical protein